MPRVPILLALLAAAAIAEDRSVLRNGGFERGMSPWFLANNSGRTSAEIDRNEKKEGKASLHLSKTGPGRVDLVRVNLGKLPAGRKLTFSAWIRAERVGNAWFKVYYYGENDRTKVDPDTKIRGTHGWKQYKASSKVPKWCTSAAIIFMILMPGDLWIDGVTVTGPGITAGAKEDAPRPLDRKLKSWLDRNALEVRTLDFEGSLNDLRPLKRTLKDVRIVQVGEPTHGSAASFRAKARLVRFLHEELGFDVLAFESGLYECERSNELFAKGDTRAAVHGSVFAIWRVESAMPLYEYIAKRAKGRRPLRVTGFDTRASGKLAKEFLLRLYDFVAPVGSVTTDEKVLLASIDDQLDSEPYKPPEEDRKRAQAALAQLKGFLESGREQLVAKHGEAETDFMTWCLDNFIERERLEFAKNEKEEKGQWHSTNIRDARMANNLRWLAEKRYPDSKIVCWAATFHQAHEMNRVAMGGNTKYYDGCRAMGEHVHEWLGEKVYTIAFAAYEGTHGIWRQQGIVAEPQTDSIEDVFHRYGKPLLFVDLRKKGPFDKPMLCGTMGFIRFLKAPWPEVVDAIFYTQEMQPTAFIGRD